MGTAERIRRPDPGPAPRGPARKVQPGARRMTVPLRRMTAHALPAPMAFADVLVQRHRGRTNPGVSWPDFPRQHWARHLRWNSPVCRPPAPPRDVPRRVAEPAIFLGPVDDHFGHIVAETVPRLYQAREVWPDLPFVLTAWRSEDPGDLPGVLRSVLDWCGLAVRDLRLVQQPAVFADLRVVAQGEHLFGPAPPADFLRLVEAHAQARLGRIAPAGVVYVGRSRIGAATGGHAGEGYLESCLATLGVRVVHPETLPLAEQLRAYAGAELLIFSEGSALHGRQLLGRIDQRIVVLLRRRFSRMGQHEIVPRAASLDFVLCAPEALHALSAEGKPHANAAMSFYDLEDLFGQLGALGLPLARVWDPAAYAAARDDDVLAWISARLAPDAEPWKKAHNPPSYYLEQFEPLGLAHLAPRAAALITAHEARA